ncbi:MAG: restriction endonuclease subunit S [Candidatus Competibacteraceae bacterium]|nr:restriction endonuclease subunit S [Candidatus Competibacteraceae bacterium]
MSEQTAEQPAHEYQRFLQGMPADWSRKEIRQLGTVVGGGTPSRDVSSFWRGTIPWVTPGEVSGNAAKFLHDTSDHISASGLAGSGANLLPAGSLMVTTRATLGARAINAVPMATNQGFKSIIFKQAADSGFYLHLFEKVQPELVRRASGTTFLEISAAEFASIEVPSPGPDEKRRITEILDTLDTAIHETEAIIAKLKAVKQGLLHDLLTRGIDTNGELRPPQAEAPHLYKKSPLGWIPKEWSESSAQSLCSVITKGTTPTAAQMWQGGGGVRFLRVDNLTFDGQFDFEASNFFVSPRTHRGVLARSVCIPGDVLTNIVGPPLGKLGLVTEEIGEVNINQAIALFRPKAFVLPRFLMLWVGSSLVQTWLRRRAKQTSGQVNLTLALCQELPLPALPIKEQQLVSARVANVDARLSCEVNDLRKLEEAKTGLMDDLLTGRVRVTPLLETTAP